MTDRAKDPQTGIAIRFIKQWDIEADQAPVRDDWYGPFPDVASVAELKAKYYNPRTWRLGRWFAKCGMLTIYLYSNGVGWTWDCGPGHELRWSRAWPWLRVWVFGQ